MTSSLTPVGLAREAIAFYQFIDPLLGKVPRDQRVDLVQGRKHNGQITFICTPENWPTRPDGFEYMMTGDPATPEFHKVFHEWIQDHTIWTLAYSDETFMALLELDQDFPDENIITELAVELYPSDDNQFLGRAHGRPGTYTAGCRGPLCRAANTIAQRKRYLGKDPEPERAHKEACLMQVAASYEAYLWYIRTVRHIRRSIKNGGQHVHMWMQLSVKDTILLDCTDESYLDEPA